MNSLHPVNREGKALFKMIPAEKIWTFTNSSDARNNGSAIIQQVCLMIYDAFH